MTPSRLQIQRLGFSSPTKESAILDFRPGLNILHGASNTGKSFMAQALDFMLGGSAELKDIPERVGYDRMMLDIIISSGSNIHLERGIDGGDFLFKQDSNESISLSAKHDPRREDNLSRYLLSLLGLKQAEILYLKTKKRPLSFRDLIDHLIVHEETIIKDSSPALSGQYISATPERSVFKLLLTGIDDTAFVVAEKPKNDTLSLEIIDQLIAEYKADMEGEVESSDVIKEQLEKLAAAIEKQNRAVDSIQENLQDSLRVRNEISEKRENTLFRIDEITGLLKRFGLLERHYTNDVKRLEAIKESGMLLTFMDYKDCPLCGAIPDNQNHAQSCDGDIKAIIDAATAEILKILQLKKELGKTVSELKTEQDLLRQSLEKLDKELADIQQTISRKLAPELADNQSRFTDLTKKYYQVNKSKDIYEKIAALEEKKQQYKSQRKNNSQSSTEAVILSKTVLGDFSRKIEDLLVAWGFPNASRVYFDEQKFDIVISDKPRGSHGKGLRAITHAAFSIGLLEYCVTKGLPHPGFVLLDSPLLAYKEPDPGDENIAQTDLKDKFYRYLGSMDKSIQIIVIENVPPPDLKNANIIHFTGNTSIKRYGLFPV